LFFRSNISFYLQNLQKLTSSNSLMFFLKPRLNPNKMFDFRNFLKPLLDFLFNFEDFFGSLQDQANRRQFHQLLNRLELFDSLRHLKISPLPAETSFDIFALKELPLELDIVNYRNNQKKCKDGSKSKKINRPNRILYIFNLSSCLGLDSIKDMFEGFEKVQKFFYLNESKNSALFYFKDVQAACHILCAFKNMKFIDK